jgi:hypothetical protein
MFRIQCIPDFSVAEHYGLRNTTCLYSKDVASGEDCRFLAALFKQGSAIPIHDIPIQLTTVFIPTNIHLLFSALFFRIYRATLWKCPYRTSSDLRKRQTCEGCGSSVWPSSKWRKQHSATRLAMVKSPEACAQEGEMWAQWTHKWSCYSN